MTILDRLKSTAGLLLNRDAQIALVEAFPRTVEFHRELWRRHNSIVEGTYPPEIDKRLGPIMQRVNIALNAAEAAQQGARAELNKAIEKAIAAGKLRREDLDGSGLTGLPLLAIAAAVVAFIGVAFYAYMQGFTASNDAASKGLSEAYALIGTAAADQVRRGNDIPPNTRDVLKPAPPANAFAGAGMAAVGLAALAILLLGGRKR